MDIREFDFDLPAELIAQEPAAERSAARLLQLDRVSGSITHSTVSALPNLRQEAVGVQQTKARSLAAYHIPTCSTLSTRESREVG